MRFLTGERYAIALHDQHGGTFWKYYRFKWIAGLRVRWSNRPGSKLTGTMLGWTL